MATALDVIKRAYRLIGVIDAEEAPDGIETETAIQALNEMLYRWERNGASIGYTTVDAPADVLTVPREALGAIAYNLAVEMAPEFDREPSQVVALRAQDGYSLVLRDAQGWMRVSLDNLPSSGFFLT